ncbi:hypothetical protein LCGC14_0444880 [marine sediment metagenome]|uniref:Uncharacterized protein n=1 Tax=marine sediment metagenome TaxID=412755 RepID=A0A0F9V659_9ZZZZ
MKTLHYLVFTPEKDRSPLKARAYSQLAFALHRGELTRPEACENCGATGPVEGHHEDYRYPLVVRWLCVRCHQDRHTRRNDACGHFDRKHSARGRCGPCAYQFRKRATAQPKEAMP